jgi:hypothetical protein
MVIPALYVLNKYRKALGLLYVSSKYGPIIAPAMDMSEWHMLCIHKGKPKGIMGKQCNSAL